MTPTIQTQIELLQDTKDELRIAIMEKGVTVSSNDYFGSYPTKISQISMTPGDKDNLFKSLIDRSITTFNVPDGTEILRPYLFRGCVNMTSLTLPNSLKIIYDSALHGLHSVTNLEVPDSVTRIEGCSGYPNTTTSLTTLTLGSGLTYIGNNAFRNNTNLTSITINAETPPVLGSNNNAFDNTNNCPIYVPGASVDAYKTAWSTYASRIQAIQQPQYFVRVNSYSDFVLDTPILIVNENNDTALDCSQILNTTNATTGLNSLTNRAKSITIDANGKILADQTTLSYAGKIGATGAGFCLYYETNNTKHYIGITTRYGYDTTTAPLYTEYIYGGTDEGVSFMIVYGSYNYFISNNSKFAVKSPDDTNWNNYTPGMAIYILQ